MNSYRRHNRDSDVNAALPMSSLDIAGCAQRQRVSIEFPDIDLSRVWETMRRDKMLDTLHTFIGE